MINHTMIVSFAEAIPDTELRQYLADIEKAMRDTGAVEDFAVRRHIRMPGEDAIPALVATAILQFGVADEAALARLFAAPGAHEVIQKWQARYPYRVAWANHEPLR